METSTAHLRRRRLLLGALGATALTAHKVAAQDKYPMRNIEMMVPWGPGGGADSIGRIVARWLESDLGITVPVINLPGGQGTIGLAKLMQHPSDGHNVGVLTSDTSMALALSSPAGRQLKLADLLPVAVLTRQPSGLFARAESRFKSWADVVAEAKAKPGAISVATTGPGSPDDMSIVVLKGKGVELTLVPFSRPGERYAAVLGGHVDLLFEQAGDIKGHLDARTLRPLLFFTATKLPAPFADVPVAGELGIDFYIPQLRSLVVRSDTDAKRLSQLAASLARFATSVEYVNYLKDQLALPDSFVPSNAAPAFLAEDIEGMRRAQASLSAGTKQPQ